MDRLLTFEERDRILKLGGIKFHDGSSMDIAKAQDEKTLKAMAEWIDRNIMKTDNRVTKLWVLGDAVKALREGKFPE
jgi:tRNA(His) 5'-end guanylyltransferase